MDDIYRQYAKAIKNKEKKISSEKISSLEETDEILPPKVHQTRSRSNTLRPPVKEVKEKKVQQACDDSHKKSIEQLEKLSISNKKTKKIKVRPSAIDRSAQICQAVLSNSQTIKPVLLPEGIKIFHNKAINFISCKTCSYTERELKHSAISYKVSYLY